MEDFFFEEAFLDVAPFFVLVEVFFAAVFVVAPEVFEDWAGAARLAFWEAATTGSVQHKMINNAANFRKRQTLRIQTLH